MFCERRLLHEIRISVSINNTAWPTATPELGGGSELGDVSSLYLRSALCRQREPTPGLMELGSTEVSGFVF